MNRVLRGGVLIGLLACGDDGDPTGAGGGTGTGSSTATSPASSAVSGSNSTGSADGGGGGSGAVTGIHLVHAADNAGSVELCVDGLPVGAPVAPRAASAVASPPPEDSYTVRVAAEGSACADPMTDDVTVTLTNLDSYAVVVFFGDGEPATPHEAAAFTIETSFATGMMRRFMHAAPGVGSLDMGEGTADDFGVTFVDATYGLEGHIVPIGTTGYVGQGALLDTIFTLRESNADIDLVSTAPIDLPKSAAYSFIAVSSAASPVGLLFCRDYPNPTCSVVVR